MKGTRFIATLLLSSALSAPTYAGTFEDALKSAYKTNPQISAQHKVLEQSNERVSQAIAAFGPDVTASYSRGRQRTRFDTNSWSHGDLDTRQVSLTQPIFLGGTNIYNYRSSKENMLASRAQTQAVEQSILLTAVVAYMDVVQGQAVLELSQNNADVLKKQLEASQDRFQVGDVTRTDVSQSEARLSRAQSDVIQAKGDLETAIGQFERVVGYRPEGVLLMPEYYPELPNTLDEVIEYALKNNPQLHQTRYEHKSAEEAVSATIGTLLPQVSLVGSINRQDGAGVTGASEFDSDSLQLSITVPIYRTGASHSRVRAARLNARQQDYEAVDTEQLIRESAIQGWESYQTAVATIEAQEQEIRAAEVALEGVRQENQYGSRTVLDVLDAEQELFAARVNLVRAQRNRVVSFYNVMLVMGNMTLPKLNVKTELYDPEEHYNDVKWQWFGF